MRIAWKLVTLALAGAVAQAADVTVAIYLENTEVAPLGVTAQAAALASQMYAQVGIRLEWHRGSEPRPAEPGNRNAVSIQFDTGAPFDFHPDALGYAQPQKQSGTRIHIFYDRVSCYPSHNHPGALLAHVIAHELGHVLEASSLHAESGIMKAHWDTADFDLMHCRPLEFTPAHAAMILAGAERIATRKPAIVLAAGAASSR